MALVSVAWILGAQTPPTTPRTPADTSPDAVIPVTWDDVALASLQVPLSDPNRSPVHISSKDYYAIPLINLVEGHDVYVPGREPAGYLDRLRQRPPDPPIVMDAVQLKTEADWIALGEKVFDAPLLADAYPVEMLREPAFYEKTGMRASADGRLPYFRYVVQEKGKVVVATLSCASCHTRVMEDGTVVKGAQGTFPLERSDAYWLRREIALAKTPAGRQEWLDLIGGLDTILYRLPGLLESNRARGARPTANDLLRPRDRIPAGVLARHGTSLRSPVQVPDLIGVHDRRYLDRTGIVQHREGSEAVDFMRYAALNQGADFLSSYGGYVPNADGSPFFPRIRYSDVQLFALARYVYSLRPPPNPHRLATNEGKMRIARGEDVFERLRCGRCHSGEAYTSNSLTPVDGFRVPGEHLAKYRILEESVGTDPTLALTTRRGSGYYKIPSLRGVWYRGPFEHNGSVATLEDWFDPARLRDDYVPTGWVGPPGTNTRAVRGHRFGLNLPPDDRQALIAFLKTL